MTSSERVRTTLEGRIPDRVPLFELFIDPKVIDSVRPGMSYEDFADFADLDVVTCLTMVESMDAMHWVDRDRGTWRDRWGGLQGFTGEVLSVPLEPPRITCEEELEAYVPPDPLDNEVIGKARALVARFKGKKAVCVVGEDVFAVSQYLRAGLANLMEDYLLRPALAHKLARIGVEYHVELYRALIAEGVEIIALGDDYAGKTGTMMSPRHFQEFVLPGLRTIVSEIKARGAFCIKHTDGNVWGILDMLISTGVDALGPLEGPYMALDEVRRHSGSKVGVVGNVDVDLLSRGSVHQVVAATRQQLARVSPLGGHLLGSGNSISSSVKGENFMAMVQTVQREGAVFGVFAKGA
jgi:uroporphyrinogen decarboxylase